MEAGNVKRLVLVGAVDVRDREKGYPEWYDEASSEFGVVSHWWDAACLLSILLASLGPSVSLL